MNIQAGAAVASFVWKSCKSARWVDYSGRTGRDTIEGLTLMDHPKNPNHPSVFHVRNNGWMGASLTFAGERLLARGEVLRLRYGLYVHGGQPSSEVLDGKWKAFATFPLPERKN